VDRQYVFPSITPITFKSNPFSVHDGYGDSKPGDWTFMILMSWIPSDPNYDTASLQGDKILADMKARTQIFSEKFRELWEAIPEDTRCWHNRLSYWLPPAEGWDSKNGTITLVGDAAHPMTYRKSIPISETCLKILNCSLVKTAAKASTTQSTTSPSSPVKPKSMASPPQPSKHTRRK
jgi:hypothetical protein